MSFIQWVRATSAVIVLIMPVLLARQLARGGTPTARQRPAGIVGHEVEPKRDEPPKQDPIAEFRKRYELGPDQDLRRVPPPFHVSRDEYCCQVLPAIRDALRAEEIQNLVFRQRDGDLGIPAIHTRPRGAGARGITLSNLLGSMTGFPSDEIEGEGRLLASVAEGDFVIRSGTPMERLIGRLGEILRDECKLPVRLALREVDREVVVARGRYLWAPLGVHPIKTRFIDDIEFVEAVEHIDIYGAVQSDRDHGGIARGNLSMMFRQVGEFIRPRTRIINEVEVGPKERLEWHLNGVAEPTPAIEELNNSRREVLDHLAAQTGLTFKTEHRKVRTLLVEPEN